MYILQYRKKIKANLVDQETSIIESFCADLLPEVWGTMIVWSHITLVVLTNCIIAMFMTLWWNNVDHTLTFSGNLLTQMLTNRGRITFSMILGFSRSSHYICAKLNSYLCLKDKSISFYSICRQLFTLMLWTRDHYWAGTAIEKMDVKLFFW